jgi:CheY-like chemotaxis protein
VASDSILIVEDEMVLAMSMESVLKSMGYEVTGIALSGEDAISLTEKSPPSLVMMDITLGDKMDGIEAANEIIEKFGVPVIFLTGYSDETTLTRLENVVHYGVLQKPVDEYTLRHSIEAALKKHKETKSP